MTKIIHSDMRRGGNVQPSTQIDPKTFIVDDLSVDDRLSAFEGGEEINEVQNISSIIPKPLQDAMDENTKKTLEKLIFMGRYSKEIEFADHKFELSTLTHKENNEIIKELIKFGDAANLFTVRVLTLSSALKKIDGVSLDDLEFSGDFENDFYRRMAIIDNMQVSLVERIHNAYEEMVKEAETVVYHENVKK
jgi:hypothetical protein